MTPKWLCIALKSECDKTETENGAYSMASAPLFIPATVAGAGGLTILLSGGAYAESRAEKVIDI